MVGAASVTLTVAESVALAGVPSSSWPPTVTTLTTVPAASGAAVVTLKVRSEAGRGGNEAACRWASQAASAAGGRLPSPLSATRVKVTGSVLAGLVLVIVKV